MKSIMQAASSVIKAIEKGWEAAGKPKQFTITVFEEPKKNFIGMTVQSAKVGIFFDEQKVSNEKETFKPAPVKKREIPARAPLKKEHHTVAPRVEKSEPQPGLRPKQPQRSIHKPESQENVAQQKIVWTPEMVSFVQEWLHQTLAVLNLKHITFTVQPLHYQLTITFDKPLLENGAKEQQLMKSFSLLLIQTLRNTFKRPLRGFKIMMTQST
jgi:predicted RNA-binding protein Jag